MANRQIVHDHYTEIVTKAGEICGSLWHDRKREAIPEERQREIIDAAASAHIESVVNYYDPVRPKNGASALTYGGGRAAYCAANKATAQFFDEKKRGMSLDDEVNGGKDGSRPMTYAETLSDDVFGRLPLHMKVDLLLLKPHLTAREWEVFFERRYIRYMEHAEIAREFNWTESRYRWFWGNLKKKLLILCDLRLK